MCDVMTFSIPNPDKPELKIEDCKLNIKSTIFNYYRVLIISIKNFA